MLEQIFPANQNRSTGILQWERDLNVLTVLTVCLGQSPQFHAGPQLTTGQTFTVFRAKLAKRTLTKMTHRNARHVQYVLKEKQLKITAP